MRKDQRATLHRRASQPCGVGVPGKVELAGFVCPGLSDMPCCFPATTVAGNRGCGVLPGLPGLPGLSERMTCERNVLFITGYRSELTCFCHGSGAPANPAASLDSGDSGDVELEDFVVFVHVGLQHEGFPAMSDGFADMGFEALADGFGRYRRA
jgi:hypothetical protein